MIAVLTPSVFGLLSSYGRIGDFLYIRGCTIVNHRKAFWTISIFLMDYSTWAHESTYIASCNIWGWKYTVIMNMVRSCNNTPKQNHRKKRFSRTARFGKRKRVHLWYVPKGFWVIRRETNTLHFPKFIWVLHCEFFFTIIPQYDRSVMIISALV